MTIAMLALALLLGLSEGREARVEGLQDDSAEALKKFDAAYKSKDPAARAAAVTELAKTDHEKIIAKLEKLLVVDAKEVRLAAAAGLGIIRETKEHNKKEMVALSKGMVPNYQERAVILAIVEALDKFGDGVGLTILHPNCALPTIPIARAMIEATGEIRRKESVPFLIALIKQLEAAARYAANVGPGGRTVTGGGIPGTGGAGGNAGDPDAPKRAKELVPVATKALESITKKSFKTTPEWEAWWKKEGADFKVEP